MRKRKPHARKEVKINTEKIEVKVYSNDIKDACKVQCKICEKEVVMSSMSKHTRRVHCLLLTEYKDIYGDHKKTICKKTYHKCGLCKKDLFLDVLEIAIHLRKKKHDISPNDYSARFLTRKVILNSLQITRAIERKPKEENAVLYKGKYKKEEFKSLTTQQLLEEIDLALGA